MVLLNRIEPLTVVGPAGIAEIVQAMPGVRHDDLTFRLAYVELWSGARWSSTRKPSRSKLDHRVFAVGYRFQEKTQPGRI